MKNLYITVPIFNEGEMTAVNAQKIYNYCIKNISSIIDWKIVLTENGSSDNTFEIAQKMAQKYPNKIFAFHFNNRGKANALKSAWQKLDQEKHQIDFISIVDVDIPFNLDYLKQAIQEILNNNYDLVVGNRYSKNSKTQRPLDQIIVSKIYNFLARLLLGIKVKDIQCGLKIFRYPKIKKYLPECDHPHGFFDLQILKKLTKNNHPIKSIPINWNESNNRPTKFVKKKEVLEGVKTLFKLAFKN